MVNKQNTVEAPSLLNNLVSLTTIRDIELFEISLLKTLTGLLKIKQISMYKLNQSNNTTCWLATYSNNLIQDDQKQQFLESRETFTSEIIIPEEIAFAKSWIETTQKPLIQNQEHSFSVVYPILNGNQVISLLTFDLSHPLTEKEIIVITSLLSITHNFQSLLDESQKDKLTALLNRQTFDGSINKIQSITLSNEDNILEHPGKRKSEYLQKKFYLAIVDIDNFKLINDQYGHIIGDEVLLLLSYIMKQTFRAKDLLFRFGGEEFVVITHSSDQEEARKTFERFREGISKHRFPKTNRVTVSIGATLINKNNLFASGIIGRADQALHHAKENGKNQLHFYEDLLQSGHITAKEGIGTIDLF